MPKVKTKLNIRSFPPWAKYEATSKVFDLTLIELSAEFQVSKKESQKIFSVAALEINYIQIRSIRGYLSLQLWIVNYYVKQMLVK